MGSITLGPSGGAMHSTLCYRDKAVCIVTVQCVGVCVRWSASECNDDRYPPARGQLQKSTSQGCNETAQVREKQREFVCMPVCVQKREKEGER